MNQPTIASLQLEIKDLKDELRRDHDHMKKALISKMRDASDLRAKLADECLRLQVLPEHADTHMECYSEYDLINALVAALEQARDEVQS